MRTTIHSPEVSRHVMRDIILNDLALADAGMCRHGARLDHPCWICARDRRESDRQADNLRIMTDA